MVRRNEISAIPITAWCQTAFAALLVTISAGAFSWYWVIAPGARFILVFYAPLLASLFLALKFLRRRIATLWGDGLCVGATLIAFGHSVIHLAQIWQYPYFDRLKTAF